MNKFLKTIALTCIISVCSALSLHAQRYDFYYEEDRPLVDLGFKFGIGLTSDSFKGAIAKSEMRTGVDLGIIVDFNLPANFMVLTGLDYKNKGGKLKGVEGRLNAMYLTLPVQFGYRFVTSDKVDFQIFAGPYIALGFGGDTFFNDPNKVDFGKDGIEKIDTFGSYGFAKRMDFGLTFGAGVTFNQQFLFRASYDMGLTNIANNKFNLGNITSIKNRGIYFAFGVLI